MPPYHQISPYKKNLLHRAYHISSSKTIFYKELKNIKQTFVNNNFANKIIDQQIKQYLHNIHKNSNNNNNNTNRINLYYKNQMHKNYKVDEHAITNIIHRYIKPTEPPKQINSLSETLNLKHQTLSLRITQTPAIPLTPTNIVYKFTYPFRECTYIGHTTTTLSRRFTYHLSDMSTIKQHTVTKHNKVTDKLKSPDIRKIFTDHTKIIYKSNNKSRLQILKAITIKK